MICQVEFTAGVHGKVVFGAGRGESAGEGLEDEGKELERPSVRPRPRPIAMARMAKRVVMPRKNLRRRVQASFVSMVDEVLVMLEDYKDDGRGERIMDCERGNGKSLGK